MHTPFRDHPAWSMGELPESVDDRKAHVFRDQALRLRIDPTWACPSSAREPRVSAWKSVGSHRPPRPGRHHSLTHLVGHLFATTLIYLVLFTLAWALGVFSAWLNELHALPDETLALLSRVELAIIYGDTAVCGYFWLIGAYRFLKELML